MENQALFVDFMYAAVVAAALPRLQDEEVLEFKSPTGWGLLFMVGVFLEDFFIYHVKVVPQLKAPFPSAFGFILTMMIILAWYLSQAAFPAKPRLFLTGFALFFFCKLAGGFRLRPTRYPSKLDFLFLLPIGAAVLLLAMSRRDFFKSHPGRFLYILFPTWLLMVVLWWSIESCLAPAAAS